MGGNGHSIVSTYSGTIFRTGCGRLQLGAAQWATSVTLQQVVDNWHHKIVVVDSPLLGSRLKKTLYYFAVIVNRNTHIITVNYKINIKKS